MSHHSHSNEAAQAGEIVSAWIDDESMPADSGLPALSALLARPEVREQCAIYRVIGDVLREGEAGVQGQARSEFVRSVMNGLSPLPDRRTSESMTDERGRVPLAPSPDPAHASQARAVQAANDAVFRWRAIAGLAGVVAVGTLAWHLLSGDSSSGAPVLAENRGPGVVVDSRPDPVAAPVMIRDPRLDELIAQHRQAAGVSAFQNGSGFLRAATYEGGGR